MPRSVPSKPKPRANAPLADSRVAKFEAIGTLWEIDVYDDVDSDEFECIISRAHEVIEDFDRRFSRFRADSLVALMSREAGIYNMQPDAWPMLDLYNKLYEVSAGLMTPMIGSTLSAAGYDAQYSFTPSAISSPPKWSDVATWSRPAITLNQPALLDFGAGGKGLLVDIVAGKLQGEGIKSYCVDAGGDMTYRHADETLAVGLEHPLKNGDVVGIASIKNQSICGSAGNRRTWSKYHHIINPDTLESPKHILATWVVADSTLLADMLTTALYFVSAEKLKAEFNFEYALVTNESAWVYSSGFPAELFATDKP